MGKLKQLLKYTVAPLQRRVTYQKFWRNLFCTSLRRSFQKAPFEQSRWLKALNVSLIPSLFRGIVLYAKDQRTTRFFHSFARYRLLSCSILSCKNMLQVLANASSAALGRYHLSAVRYLSNHPTEDIAMQTQGIHIGSIQALLFLIHICFSVNAAHAPRIRWTINDIVCFDVLFAFFSACVEHLRGNPLVSAKLECSNKICSPVPKCPLKSTRSTPVLTNVSACALPVGTPTGTHDLTTQNQVTL